MEQKYKVCVFSQCFNELETGHLSRWINNVKKFADVIAVYSDGSTDGSYEYLVPFCDLLIKGKTNAWKNELKHKQNLMIEVQTKLKPDFIFWLDIDEIASRQIVENIQIMCHTMRKNKYDGAFFREINLWKSEDKYRVDDDFFDTNPNSNIGWFCRLWDCGNSKKLEFLSKEKKKKEDPTIQKEGLHHQQYPMNINFTIKNPYVVLHYGFSSEQLIKNKYERYKKTGQIGPSLERISPDSKAVLVKANPEWFVKKELIK